MRRTTRALLLLGGCLVITDARAQDPEGAAFRPVAGLLQKRCATSGCHAGTKPVKGLSLRADDIYRSTVNVPSRTHRKLLRVAPGDPERSLLYLKLLLPHRGGYRGGRMPLSMDPLTDQQIALIRAWIESFPDERWGTPDATDEAGATTPRTFHDSTLANLPTPDPLGAGVVEFRILHRFRTSVNDAGGEGLYGLDGGAWISLALGYGLTEKIEVALRRTSLQTDYEASAKWALLRQKPGHSPISVAVRGSYSTARDDLFANRTRWGAQAIFGRRFNDVFSVMLVPTYVTRTNFQDPTDESGTSAIGLGGEFRLTTHTAVTGEWVAQTGGVKARYQGIALGYSIATARHAFHLVLSNTQGTHIDLYAPGGDLSFESGDFRLGFNISRSYGGR